MVHIGKLIEAELRRQERSVSWFARNLYCERTNVYDIFKRRSVDTELLMRISRLLNRNFFLVYVRDFDRIPDVVPDLDCGCCPGSEFRQ